MRKIFFILTIIILSQIKKSVAQQAPHYSLYTLGKLFYNPAYINDKEKNLAITLLNKNQWRQVDQTYNSQGLSLNTTFSQRRLGIGLIILTEKTQNIKRSQVLIPVSYKLNVKNGFLNLGIETGIKTSNNDFSGLEIKDKNDHVISRKPEYVPDFSLGAFYRKKNYYIGLSLKHLFPVNGKKNSTLYGIWAHELSINSLISILPSTLIRLNQKHTVLDIGTHVKINQKMLIGGHIRTSKQFNLQGSIILNKLFSRINNDFVIGYSFDYGYSESLRNLGSSHEIMLKYNLQKRPNPNAILKQRKTVSPLFF